MFSAVRIASTAFGRVVASSVAARVSNAAAREAPRAYASVSVPQIAQPAQGASKTSINRWGIAAFLGVCASSYIIAFSDDDRRSFAFAETKKKIPLSEQFLTPALYAKLKKLSTANGFTIDDVVRSGKENPDSSIGCYAGDAESYQLFAEFFDKVIQAYHNYDRKKGKYVPNLNPDDLNIDNPDPEGKYVVSTRIRVGRNLEGEAFSPALRRNARLRVEQRVVDALSGLKGDLAGHYYPLGDMKEEDRVRLVKDHFLFKKGDRFLQSAGCNRDWPDGRGIFHSADKKFLVWVNEEDQIRIISMQPGADIKQVFERLSRAIGSMERAVSFAFDPQLGWLSSCPTNLGTSMRASVHIKLPKLAQDANTFNAICEDLKLDKRGIHGEHSESEGGVFDISNKQRLGISEVDAALILHRGVKKLIEEEKKRGG